MELLPLRFKLGNCDDDKSNEQVCNFFFNDIVKNISDCILQIHLKFYLTEPRINLTRL